MSEDNSEPVSLGTATVKRETPKALLVEVEGEEMWVPKSVIHEDSEVWQGEQDDGELVVKRWWAEKEGQA
jgi:hypothetical protein